MIRNVCAAIAPIAAQTFFISKLSIGINNSSKNKYSRITVKSHFVRAHKWSLKDWILT